MGPNSDIEIELEWIAAACEGDARTKEAYKKLVPYIRSLENKTCSHGPYQIWGTNDCNECDTGRITLYYLDGVCTECKGNL